MNPVPGAVVAERYRLERPLAAGGMGTIWVARHLQLDVDVAVKFMSGEVDGVPASRARFEREAKAAARLRTPHVVRTYDYGVDGGTPFLAMELLEGESLESKLRRGAPLSLAVTAAIFRQVAKGLSEAHAIGIVHRDLKPANIFMARAAGEEVVKVLDFGIAKETRDLIVDEETKSGVLLGSPHHMSPEQARGGRVDARSDLWSLGVVLFRMVTGEKPFAGTNVGDVIAKICADTIPKPSAFVPTLAAPIDAFFDRALARNPALRFQTVEEMSAAFDRAAGLEPASPLVAPLAAPIAALEITPRDEITRGVEAPAGPVDAEPTAMGTTSDHAAPAPGRSRSPVLMAALIAVPALALVAAFYAWPRGGAGIESAPQAAASAPSEVATHQAEVVVAPQPSAAGSVVLPARDTASAAPSASASARVAAPLSKTLPRGPMTATAKAPRRPEDPFF